MLSFCPLLSFVLINLRRLGRDLHARERKEVHSPLPSCRFLTPPLMTSMTSMTFQVDSEVTVTCDSSSSIDMPPCVILMVALVLNSDYFKATDLPCEGYTASFHFRLCNPKRELEKCENSILYYFSIRQVL